MAERVLITGANGFIGRHSAAAFEAGGWRVRRAVRDQADCGEGDCVAVGDLRADCAWDAALADVDVVLHLAARVHRRDDGRAAQAYVELNVHATEALARQAAARGARRFLFASSAAVHGEGGTEVPIRESDALAPVGAYARSKRDAEVALGRISDETGMQVIAVRPPMVYGPGNPGNLPRLMRLIQAGVPLPLALVRNHRSFLFVRNLVDVLVHLADPAQMPARQYVVSDGAPVSMPTLVRTLAASMGRGNGRLVPFPTALLRMLGVAAGWGQDTQRVLGSFVLDDRAIREDLRWHPPFTFAEGIDETAKWFVDGRFPASMSADRG